MPRYLPDLAGTIEQAFRVADISIRTNAGSIDFMDKDGLSLVDISAKKGTFSGVVSITDTTDSTTPITGALVVSGGVGIAGALYLGGAAALQGNLLLASSLTPAQITSNQNDYAPTGHGNVSRLRLSSDASRTLTGLAGGVDGRMVMLNNVGAFSIVLSHASVSSTDVNRFLCPNNTSVTVRQNGSVRIVYDGISQRWRIQGA